MLDGKSLCYSIRCVIVNTSMIMRYNIEHRFEAPFISSCSAKYSKEITCIYDEIHI